MNDLGWTHVALTVADLERSIAFYARYAGFSVCHVRQGSGKPGSAGTPVAWLGDGRRDFALVLAQVQAQAPQAALSGFAHLGVACASRAVVDERCGWADAAGCLVLAPRELGPPVGYSGFIADPDGHQIELSYGQEVAAALHAVAPGLRGRQLADAHARVV